MSETKTATEIERLAARRAAAGVTHHHESWGPGGHKLSDEDKAAVINNVLDQAEAQARDLISVRRVDAYIVYEALRRVSALGKTDVRDISTQSEEVSSIKRAINAAVDMALLHAGQMLTDEDRKQIRENVSRESKAI